MKAIYQKNYNLFLKKIVTEKQLSPVVGLDNGFWNGKSPRISHTTYSINQSWKQPYGSPLFHINLHDLHSPEQIHHLPFVLVRDGLFLLLDFFNRFPDPKVFHPIFLICSIHASFIPEAWHKKVLIYDFVFSPESKVGKIKSKGRKFLVKGMYNDDLVDYENLLEKINYCSELGKTSVALFMQENPFLHLKWQGNELIFSFANFMEKLKSNLKYKENVEFLTYEQMYKMKDLSEIEFADENIKENYYIDEYLNFFLLKNGAKPLEKDLGGKIAWNGKFTRLTSVHGIFIHEFYELNLNKKLAKFSVDLNILTEKEASFNVSHFSLIDKYFSSAQVRVRFLTL